MPSRIASARDFSDIAQSSDATYYFWVVAPTPGGELLATPANSQQPAKLLLPRRTLTHLSAVYRVAHRGILGPANSLSDLAQTQ